jgi:hypothetical protein
LDFSHPYHSNKDFSPFRNIIKAPAASSYHLYVFLIDLYASLVLRLSISFPLQDSSTFVFSFPFLGGDQQSWDVWFFGLTYLCSLFAVLPLHFQSLLDLSLSPYLLARVHLFEKPIRFDMWLVRTLQQ